MHARRHVCVRMCAAVCVSALVCAHNNTHVVVRRAPSLKAPWSQGSRLPSWHPLAIRFAVKEKNMDRLKAIAGDVSNPASPRLGVRESGTP